MENNNYTIALLIDTENVSSKYLEALKEELNVLGKITYLRMYGDFTLSSSKNWKILANDYAITPVQQYRYTKGKNASDSRLIIDAMDILYSENVDAFCLMSSDSDYTGLVKRLKESNIFVIGAGEKKTAPSFVKACDRFFYLDELSDKEVTIEKETKDKKKRKKVSKSESMKKDKDLLKEEVENFAIKVLENNPGQYLLSKLMQKIYQKFPQFNFNKYKVRRAQDFFTMSKDSKFVVSKGKTTEVFIELK